MAADRWFLYLLECSNGSYYAGISTDVQARFQIHLTGKGARYTRAYPPQRILGFREYPDRSAASRAEWQIKQLPRARKLAWLQSDAAGIECRAVPRNAAHRGSKTTPGIVPGVVLRGLQR